ncbi:hypothetical protein J1614_000499 [Plenodomus biglobosus]|nr:hypothetical protein J1614_000499 [Plenodomus biglobosus]
MSSDPFNDSAAMDVLELGHIEDHIDSSPKKNNDNTACRPERIAVPILDTLSPLRPWSTFSTVPTPEDHSTAPKSACTATNRPVKWNNTGLMYLLSILYPSSLLTNHLILHPPLSTTPTHLQLFSLSPANPPTSSTHLPTSTSRPPTPLLPLLPLLLADSGTHTTPHSAARALAHALLRNTHLVRNTLDKYNVLCTLHTLSTDTLLSLQHSMHLMSRVSDAEWHARLLQLRGGSGGTDVDTGTGVDTVDETCGVGARLEVFLLASGRGVLEEWRRRVGVVVGLGGEERRAWGEVYGEAGGFLRRAVGEWVG